MVESLVLDSPQEHNPELETELCTHILANPTDSEARSQLALNNIRYSVVVGGKIRKEIQKEYGSLYDQDIGFAIVSATFDAAMSPKYDPHRPFKDYAGRAVVNRLKNLKEKLENDHKYRARNIEALNKLYFLDDWSRNWYLTDTKQPSPLERAEMKSAREYLEQLIDYHLTPNQARAIRLYFLEDVGDQVEISKILNCTRANVGIAISRGLKTLREVLKTKGCDAKNFRAIFC